MSPEAKELLNEIIAKLAALSVCVPEKQQMYVDDVLMRAAELKGVLK